MYYFIKRLLTILFSLTILAFAITSCSGLPDLAISQPKTVATTPTPPLDERTAAIAIALQQAVSSREDVIAFLLYNVTLERAEFTEDGSKALVWYTLADKGTGEILEGEASLALAVQSGGTWRIVVQADPDWAEILNSLPDELLGPEQKALYMPDIQQVAKDHQVFTGYRLPWPGGTRRRVSGSIGHFLTYKSCPSTCMYAYDFADGTMFPVVAAKGGTVKYAEWRYPNGNTEHANYLVLEDTTTTPTTYQVYYHLAQDSIPVELRAIGAPVYQGQFIGNADDTGYSSGHHLHFHVHTNGNAVWGTSVDIVFEDVADNGGRPRTCLEAAQFPDYGRQCASGNWYVSNNYGDAEPPTGNITAPADGQLITEAVMNISGVASDNTSVASIQVLANWDGSWKSIGPAQTASPFHLDVNVCEVGIPDGPFLLALQIKDQGGRLSQGAPGQKLLEKKYDCNPAPTPEPCNPGIEQAALYTETNYQGACQIFEIGDYKTAVELGTIGNDEAASIRLGSNVMALVYSEENFEGAKEAFLADDPDLSDNPAGANTLSSLSVQKRIALPGEPAIFAPRNQSDLQPTEVDDLTLKWKGDEVSREFKADLNGPSGLYRTLDWQMETSWKVGQLPSGDYTLVVTARNAAGETRSSLNFSVARKDPPPSASLEPISGIQLSTAIHLKWSVANGEKEIDHFKIQYRVDGGGWEDWERPLQSAMREAWFIGQPGHLYEFRLQAVGVRGDSAPYSETAGVSLQIPPDCQPDAFEGTNPGDDEFISAAPLDIDASQEHNLCGMSDTDWVAFPAEAGQAYHIVTTPVSGGAAASVQLYAPDGYSLLGEAQPENLAQPASLDWIAPEDGIYYVRVSPFDAGLMGSDARYDIRVARLSKIFTPTLACSSLLLPVIWLLVRAYLNAKRKRS